MEPPKPFIMRTGATDAKELSGRDRSFADHPFNSLEKAYSAPFRFMVLISLLVSVRLTISFGINYIHTNRLDTPPVF